MAKVVIEIEAEGERSALTELQHLVSQAIDQSAVEVNFTSSTVNHSSPDTTTRSVRLFDLIDESTSSNARRAITVLEQNAGVVWMTQLMEMSEEEVLNVYYFGEILLPELQKLLKKHGHTWPS